MNLKQFKLTNNDEIICEVVEDTEAGLVIRKALRVISADDFEDNIRFYQFRPWISFQDNFDELCVLNIGHIIGETVPSKTLVVHFANAVNEVEASQEMKKEFNLDELINEMEELSDEEIRELVNQKVREKEYKQKFEQDSAQPNIIHFKPTDTKH